MFLWKNKKKYYVDIPIYLELCTDETSQMKWALHQIQTEKAQVRVHIYNVQPDFHLFCSLYILVYPYIL